MFSLPKFSIKRPVCILICVAALVIFGTSSVFGMQMESTPEMSMPVLMIMTQYDGASPEEVDSMVTDKVESALASITEVESMTSTSSDGRSRVQLEFGYDVDIDTKYDDVTTALATLNLPDGCGDPTIMEMNMSAMNDSIMTLTVNATAGDQLTAYLEDNLVPQIERIEGVASAEVSGGSRKYIRVELDENSLEQYGLTMSDVSNAIGSAEFNITMGDLDRGDVTVSAVGSYSIDDYNAIADIPISLKSGDIIHVSDVAQVTMATQERSSYSRNNGNDTIRVSVTKEQSGNTVSICSQIKTLVEKINASGDLGVDINIQNNSGETISENIQNVLTSLIEGLIIAALVLVFFFGEWKSSFIVCLAMPLSIFTALVCMSLGGMTINMMSLGGLVVGIGMVGDNSIVVVESCFNAKKRGGSFMDQVSFGSDLVTSSIVASTITTVVVFLPIARLNGMTGQLFRDVCYTVVFALLSSLVCALTVVPCLFYRMRPVENEHCLCNRMLAHVYRGYTKLLRKALNARVVAVVIAVGSLAFAAFMFTRLNMELMPSMDRGDISLSVETKPNLNLDASNAIVEKIEAVVAAEPAVDTYSVSLSGGGGGGPMGGGSSSTGSISITLKDNAGVSSDEFVNSLKKKLTGIDNCVIDVSKQSAMSFGSGTTAQLTLTGSDLSVLNTYADKIKENLAANMPEFEKVATSLSDGAPQAKITVDPILASSAGMTPKSVLTAATNKINGVTATKIQENDTEYSVTVTYPTDRYKDVSDLYGLMIDLPSGGQMALTDMATITYQAGPTSISRVDGDYQVTITGTPSDSAANINSLTQKALKQAQTISLPDGITLAEGSSMRTKQTEFSSIYKALAVAVFLVFAVMAIQFESLRFSGVVMLSIPFSLTGAFLLLALTGSSISMTSLLGFVMLAGIVVNNAIVLIDYTNFLRGEGMEVHDALVEAGRTRLRPILMSTITTVVGLIPMAMGLGGKVETMQGMAVVVIGGLSMSTLLTLILIPTFYLIFDKKPKKQKPGRRKHTLFGSHPIPDGDENSPLAEDVGTEDGGDAPGTPAPDAPAPAPAP